MDSFPDFIAKERERLHKAREDAKAKLADITSQLDKIENELRAIEAYEAAKQRQTPPPPKATRRTL
jgi:prefoldin subunit 5